MISEHVEDMDRHSAFIDDLETLSYYLHFQEIREFPKWYLAILEWHQALSYCLQPHD